MTPMKDSIREAVLGVAMPPLKDLFQFAARTANLLEKDGDGSLKALSWCRERRQLPTDSAEEAHFWGSPPMVLQVVTVAATPHP